MLPEDMVDVQLKKNPEHLQLRRTPGAFVSELKQKEQQPIRQDAEARDPALTGTVQKHLIEKLKALTWSRSTAFAFWNERF